MTDSTIPNILRYGNFDARGWSSATEGDFICLRDPSARALGQVFRIEGRVALEGGSGDRWACSCTLVAVNGNDVAHNNLPAQRSFDAAAWQVWHNYDVPRLAADIDISISDEDFAQGVNTLIEMLEAEARQRGWCSEYNEFKAEVNERVGFDLFPSPEYRSLEITITCDVGPLTDAAVARLQEALSVPLHQNMVSLGRRQGVEPTSVRVSVAHRHTGTA